MAFTLSNLLVEAYKELGQLTVSTATGGSTSTVVDSKQAGIHGDNSWKEGGVFILRDAGGASAAPEGEFKRCSAFTDSTGTFTVESVFTTSPASGDTYGFVGDYYPFYTMIELANAALQSLGDIPLVDTSLTSAASQTEYDYAVGLKRQPPFKVEVQGRTSDANDNQPVPLSSWEYRPATAGTAGTLFLPQLPTGRTIYVWYMGPHPVVKAYNSAIYEGFDPELVTRMLVEEALSWQNARMQGQDDYLLQTETKATGKRMEIEAKRRAWMPKRRSKLLVLGGYTEYDEDEIPAPPPA